MRVFIVYRLLVGFHFVLLYCTICSYVLVIVVVFVAQPVHRHYLQPWARAVCTLPAVPRSTQPSTLRGTVNEYQLSG